MKINEVIRKQRIEKGLTQEKVAEILGVSAPAVNKWERAASYPDITLLAPLARLLDVDLNTLLSFHEDLTDREVDQFIEALAKCAETDGVDRAYQLALHKIREYPSCEKLMLNAALAMDGFLLLDAGKDRDRYAREIEFWYARAAKSQDPQISGQAKAMRISRLRARGEYESAEKLLEELPDQTTFDKRQMQISLYIEQEKLEEAALIAERKLLNDAGAVQSTLYNLLDIALKQGRKEDAEHIAEASKKLTHALDQWSYNAHAAHFQLHYHQKDAKNCLTTLNQLLKSLSTQWNPQNSPLYRHLPIRKEKSPTTEKLLHTILAELSDKDNHESDFLRDLPEFKALLTQLR